MERNSIANDNKSNDILTFSIAWLWPPFEIISHQTAVAACQSAIQPFSHSYTLAAINFSLFFSFFSSFVYITNSLEICEWLIVHNYHNIYLMITSSIYSNAPTQHHVIHFVVVEFSQHAQRVQTPLHEKGMHNRWWSMKYFCQSKSLKNQVSVYWMRFIFAVFFCF